MLWTFKQRLYELKIRIAFAVQSQLNILISSNTIYL